MIQPISDDQNTDVTMPRGTEVAADLGFLGGMGRGVIAGDRIDRQQQAQQEQIAHVVGLREHVAARLTREVGKGPQPRDVDGRGEEQASHHQNRRRGKDDVARHVGQHRGDLDAKMVEQRLTGGDDGHKDHDLHVGAGKAEHRRRRCRQRNRPCRC